MEGVFAKQKRPELWAAMCAQTSDARAPKQQQHTPKAHSQENLINRAEGQAVALRVELQHPGAVPQAA